MGNTEQDINLGTADGPPIDENGVDLSLIQYCLSLTPAQRLRAAQDFANWVLDVRRRNGITWDPDRHQDLTG